MSFGTRVVVLAGLSLVGCFSPSIEGVECGQANSCPPGTFCNDGLCTSSLPSDASPAADSSSVDFGFSNGVTRDDAQGAGSLLVSNGTELSSDTGEIRSGGIVVRAAGAGLIDGVRFSVRDGFGIFGVLDLAIEAGATARVIGARPVVLVAAETITVLTGGVLDVGAGQCANGNEEGSCGGPGGGNGATTNGTASGCGPGANGNDLGDTGGGGGGGGAVGGAGGNTMIDGGQAGPSCLDGATFAGGSGGGRGGGSAGGSGGGGGGAIQLAAFEAISIDGIVLSPGDGGGGGGALPPALNGGGGGGAGGSIIVEAPTVTIVGAVAANGGGGGGGAVPPSGQRGSGDGEPAAGSGVSRRGGGGGAGVVAAENGIDAITDTGGGGGAVGTIRVRGLQVMLSGATLSPPPLP